MYVVLFPITQIRHGAATGLRHIIRIHGTGAGKRTDMPSDEVREMMHCNRHFTMLVCVAQ